MKKVLLVFAVIAFAGTFTSCKKDYTCECTVDGEADSTDLGKVKKKDAEDACESLETQYKGFGFDATCDIKEK